MRYRIGMSIDRDAGRAIIAARHAMQGVYATVRGK